MNPTPTPSTTTPPDRFGPLHRVRRLEGAMRVVDVMASFVGLVVLAPLLALLALAVKAGSRGTAFFGQARVGRDGRLFKLWKLRTMVADAEKLGPRLTSRGDPRVTPFGRWLRRTKLDELPQLWNVLRGDMSLVGPRPERPEFVTDLLKQIPFYGQRHVVKPGLTGWAQVSYTYGASVEDSLEKLQFDLFYIKHLNLPLDLFIILKTIKTVILRKGT